MPTIQLENVTKWYWVGKKRRERHKEFAISEVDLTIEQGEFLFVIGSAGAGKSTLLDLICGEVKPNSGHVTADGRDVTRIRRLSSRSSRVLFGKVDRESRLIRKESVLSNVRQVARTGRRMMEPEDETMARVHKALALVGMSQKEDMYPWELSRGEGRRVELASALVNSPAVLVLDDLIANLDDDSIWDMFLLLKEVNMRGTTVIMATHSSKYVNIMRQRVITLVDGQIAGDVKKGRYGIVN